MRSLSSLFSTQSQVTLRCGAASSCPAAAMSFPAKPKSKTALKGAVVVISGTMGMPRAKVPAARGTVVRQWCFQYVLSTQMYSVPLTLVSAVSFVLST